jgi:hypothetical protein
MTTIEKGVAVCTAVILVYDLAQLVRIFYV